MFRVSYPFFLSCSFFIPFLTINNKEKKYIVMSHIRWGREQNTLCKGVETFSEQTCFKALRGSSKWKAEREQYLLEVGVKYIFRFVFETMGKTNGEAQNGKPMCDLITLYVSRF